MAEQTFPRVQRIRFAYSGIEDRLAVMLTMASGEGRIGWLTRRGLGVVMQRLNTVLKQSHPAGEGQDAHDAVMALEHIGARSQIAAQREQEKDSADESTPPAPEQWTHYLVTEARIEPQNDQIVLALKGQGLPATPDQRETPMPFAGLSLTRPHAHEILRLMRAHAEQTGWRLESTIGWLGTPATTSSE